MRKSNIILTLILAGFSSVLIFPSGKEAIKIALIYPSLTKGVLHSSDSLFRPTEEWELFFLSRNYDYEMLDDEDLDEVSNDVSVIIVPSMEVVSEDMLVELKNLMNKGKGLLITENFAEFDKDGNRRTKNYDNLPGFDIKRIETNKKISVNHFLTGSTPFSIGLKPGQKILLSAKSSLFYAAGLSKGLNPEGSYLLDEYTFPGIISGSVLNTKLLWFGFSLSQLIDSKRQELLSNSLKWLSSVPEAIVNDWPGQCKFAAILFNTIQSTSDLDSTHINHNNTNKHNYFITASLLRNSYDQLKKISDSSDINIIWDDFFFSKMDPAEKFAWLGKIHKQISILSGQKYYGIAANGEFKSTDTYKMLTENGFSFIFSSRYSDSFYFDYDTTSSLYLFYQPGEDAETPKMINKGINPGGILYVNMNSSLENIYPLTSYGDGWVTTFSGLIDWAKKRKNLTTNINHSKNGEYEINIKNNNAAALQDAGIWISIPDIGVNPWISVAGEHKELTFDTAKNMYYLNLSSIGGYQEISLKIQENN